MLTLSSPATESSSIKRPIKSPLLPTPPHFLLPPSSCCNWPRCCYLNCRCGYHHQHLSGFVLIWPHFLYQQQQQQQRPLDPLSLRIWHDFLIRQLNHVKWLQIRQSQEMLLRYVFNNAPSGSAIWCFKHLFFLTFNEVYASDNGFFVDHFIGFI